MSITCCNGCVPPKRTATCHATCPEYAKQKAKHEAEREARFQKNAVRTNLYQQTGDRVAKANKRKKIR